MTAAPLVKGITKVVRCGEDRAGWHGQHPAIFYKLKSKYGGVEVSEVARLKASEDESPKLKRLLAAAMLVNVVLHVGLGINRNRSAVSS